MGQFLAAIYSLGFFVSMPVYGTRAGFGRIAPNWREFLIPNLHWFALVIIKAFLWPVVLVAWLVQGTRPSPWKALDQYRGRPCRRIVRTSNLREAEETCG